MNIEITITIFLCISYFADLNVIESSTLKSVLVVFRHGARTPLWTYKNDPHKSWSEGWGKLTIEGKNHMYTLGKRLRKDYSHFLSESYIEDEVYVRSSDTVRCKGSAQLVLAGLFPPVGHQIWNPDLPWQPIPISYVPRQEDNLLSLEKPCQALGEALKRVLSSEQMTNHTIAHEKLYKYLSLHTGQDINDIFLVHKLYDTLKIEKHHNLELPPWTKNLPWDTMYEIAALKLFIYTIAADTQKFSGGVLLKDVIDKFSERSINRSSLKLILYSAHDSTLVSALQTLGFEKQFIPDYGAHLAFELHKINDSHEIRILYAENFNSSLLLLPLSFCPSPCTLSKFEEQLRSRMILPTDWDRECLN